MPGAYRLRGVFGEEGAFFWRSSASSSRTRQNCSTVASHHSGAASIVLRSQPMRSAKIDSRTA